MTNLKRLNLNYNELAEIPSEITQLNSLKYLDLRNNLNLALPPEIISQMGRAQAILDYVRKQQVEEIHSLNEAKLIFVGQGSVGKTSLVRRLVDEDFDRHEDQTKGIRIVKWRVNVPCKEEKHDYKVLLNIWDFGGQEIMYATHKFFLTERSLYILVLDARQEEQDGRVEYWLSLINSFTVDAPVLIVINKIDQQPLDVDRRGLKKKYPTIIDFIPTSARDNTGLDVLKAAIITNLSKMEHIHTPFPASWMRVKMALATMQSERNFLPYHEYEQICKQNGVEEETSQRTLIRFLHDLGIALNFQDDDRVRNTSVLNPSWVTGGVYALLNSPILQQQHGVFHYDQLREVLPISEYPPSQYRFLLEMMLKFELAYEMDRQRMLIPDLLTKEEPEFAWDDDDMLHFAYRYHVLPRSILHRFMVRQFNLVDPDIRWRTGVLLRYDGLSALVKSDVEAKIIHIAIEGEGNRRSFLYSLRLVFAGIHETIVGILPEEIVPIPGYPSAPPISYRFLEKLEDMKAPDKQLFPGTDEFLSVQQLLGNVASKAMRKSGVYPRTDIITYLKNLFNEGEFEELLLILDIDRNDLEGNSINAQKQDCVLYLERRGRLTELLELMMEKRPNIDFEEI